MTKARLPRTAILLGILIALLFAAGPFSPTAEAAIAGCRSDPVVVLTDGTVLDVSAAIETNVANVNEIHYVIHGPVGVGLVAAIATPTLGFAGRETFTYYADAQPGQYVTETLVRTAYSSVGVTAYTTFANAALVPSSLLSLQYRPINGFNDQVLRAVLKR
jgi:hypothetical protein